MILAQFIRGPMDNQFLTLPTEKPWPRFVVPEVGKLTIPYFYLFAGEDQEIFFYLYDEFFGEVQI